MIADIQSQSAEGLLTLLGLIGIGSQTATKLAKSFQRVGEIQEATDGNISRMVSGRVLAAIRDNSLWEKSHAKAHAQIAQAETKGVRILSVFDEKYPRLLAELPDAPALLYVKGQLPKDTRCVACVGTREPSSFGAEVARRITARLSDAGYSIISGLALGVDSVCHVAALDQGGHTVAIMANGLDSVYPARNRELAARILDSGGALVSEQPLGAKAFAHNLVQRDRLQSGFSRATFVMQTDVVGGTMHTVRFTLLQNRMLFVPVPTLQHAEDPKFRGPRALAERTGTELITLLNANDELASILRSDFKDSPPAFPIASHEDYVAVLQRLEDAAYHRNRNASQAQLFDPA
jgi:DNA processing protein